MKSFFTVFLFAVFLSLTAYSQSETTDDSSLPDGNSVIAPFVIDHNSSGSDFGPIIGSGVLVTTFPDLSGNLHPMGIVFNGTNYYVVGGGTSPGDVAELDASYNLVSLQNVALDCRSAFYNPADGEVYIKGYTSNGLFRLHTNPFDGGYDVIFTGIFQDSQSKVCISPDGTKMYDHLNGTVKEYDFATGTLLNTITLDLQHTLDWPRGNLIAHTGTYLITYAHPDVYAYDVTNGSYVASCNLGTQPTSAEWSVSYTNGMFMVCESSEATWYAWTIDSGVPVELTSFSANYKSGNVQLNWTTATETNNQGFNIQRKSLNSEYISIGFVMGFGTTTEIQAYSFVDNNVSSGSYTYRLKQIDFNGTFEYSDEVTVEVNSPLDFQLMQNYPNPFNPGTNISYSLPLTSFVKLAVYNMLGEQVAILVNEQKSAGTYNVYFESNELPTGTYIYKLSSRDFVKTKKMVLMK